MAKPTSNGDCFIIMPITTPEEFGGLYKGDLDHFTHVLEELFVPALDKAGFKPIPPKSTGSDVIQAEIIKQLSEAALVLCDMSILNPNVFFEFGIRTALDKPVALVTDDLTSKIPFDTGIINFHRYKSLLASWEIQNEVNSLTEHIKAAFNKSRKRNALWKYFGVAQTGMFKPEESSTDDKIELLMNEVSSLRRELVDQNKKEQLITYVGKKRVHFPDSTRDDVFTTYYSPPPPFGFGQEPSKTGEAYEALEKWAINKVREASAKQMEESKKENLPQKDSEDKK